MSGKSEGPKPQYAFLNHLSTEELEELLRVDSGTPDNEADDERIFYILEVIEQREQACPTGRLADIAKMYVKFVDEYNTAEGEGQSFFEEDIGPNEELNIVPAIGKPRKRGRVLLVAAAIIALIGMLAPVAFGTSLFEIFATWTGERFQFARPTDAVAPGANIVNSTADVYNEMRSAIGELTTTHVIPTWYPDSYVLDSFSVNTYSDRTKFDSFYSSVENGNFSITVVVYDNMPDVYSAYYEKDDAPVTTYDIDGVTYYFMENEEFNSVAWNTGGIECQIQGTLTKDTLQKMVESLKERY